MKKEIISFIILALYILGSIGGFGYAVYSGAYLKYCRPCLSGHGLANSQEMHRGFITIEDLGGAMVNPTRFFWQ